MKDQNQTQTRPKINVYENYDEAVKMIRKAIKSLAPTVSVRRGKGTAYGWIDIDGTADEFGHFTNQEKEGLTKFGFYNVSGNLVLINPDDREWAYGKALEILNKEV